MCNEPTPPDLLGSAKMMIDTLQSDRFSSVADEILLEAEEALISAIKASEPGYRPPLEK